MNSETRSTSDESVMEAGLGKVSILREMFAPLLLILTLSTLNSLLQRRSIYSAYAQEEPRIGQRHKRVYFRRVHRVLS